MPAHGVDFNVALAAQQICFGLDEGGFVTAVPQSIGAALGGVDVLHVGSPQGDDEPRDGCCTFASNQQVNMIGHERLGV